MKVQIAMMSARGREQTTEETAARLIAVGLHELCDDPALHYIAPLARPAPSVPGWRLERRDWGGHHSPQDHWRGEGRNPWGDFAEILLSWSAERPAFFFEDDVWPCRNALHRMRELARYADTTVGLISVFDLRNEWPQPGLHAAPAGRDLWGAQALIIPAHAIAGLQMLALRGTHWRCWDTWLGHAVEELGLGVYHYAPSLVQHRGVWSIGAPGNKKAQAANFPGEDFDALGPCPFPIVMGPSPAPRGIPCNLHGGAIHDDGNLCPQLVV
jgi:hypothetical protein